MHDSQYTWMPVNDKPLNTFGTLELLFPISKKEFLLVLFQFPNFLVCTKMHHLDMILFRFNMNRSFMVLLRCHVWCVTMLPLFTYHCSESQNGILFIKQYFQIKITNNLQRV